jgi:hypothetical protein
LDAATYTDSPRAEPGYALVVSPGPAGSDTVGGVAVFQYQDGKEAGYFTFSGRLDSSAPFTLTIKGDRAATTATALVSAPAGMSAGITIENCDRLFAPAVVSAANGEAIPPAPASCTFTYKLAPAARPSEPSVVTNLTATPTINSGLLASYLDDHGWQAQYGSNITLVPGTTYLAYDPETGVDWAFASFTYSGPESGASDAPDVAMQDGGDTGIFYMIPLPGTVPAADSGWVMVGEAGEPRCLSVSLLPAAVSGLWGLVDPPECTSAG